MKSIRFNLLYFVAVLLTLLASSCADDFPYYSGEIPEGEGNLSATITFTPGVAANLGGTRTAGDAIQTINSLCVLVYTTDGDLVRKYSQDELLGYNCDQTGYEVDKNQDHLDGNQAHTDEIKTPQATFALPGLPYGRYRIYAVANMGNLSNYDVSTIDNLKNISLVWNVNDISLNNQMFGYFTDDDNRESSGFDNANAVTFTPSNNKFHAWVKRAASKVTIAFDPSGLNQDVWVYIKNVTIRDIPKTCLLGAENTPDSDDDLLNHLATPYAEPDYSKPSEAVVNTRFEYNSDGLIESPDIHTGSAKTDGYVLTNKIRKAVPENAHSASAQALFFYENNQGDKSKDPNVTDKEKYNKQQKHSNEADGVGTPIRDNINGNDFKDRVPYGTYIEVEAYYISNNPGNPGEGSIKYRFMLGKNITYDYDAQRNYHFKVTLGFNGWANQPDWHIDYEQPMPGIEVPPVFRVSYLYHQKSMLPIKILGNCTKLSMYIVENNWAPYDPKTKVPTAIVTSSPSTYQFEWNRTAYENYYKPIDIDLKNYKNYIKNVNGEMVFDTPNGKINYTHFGFLSLNMPENMDQLTTAVDMEFSEGDKAQTALMNHYKSNKEGVRLFNAEGATDGLDIGKHDENSVNEYVVNPVSDDLGNQVNNQKVLLVPLWTRAKTLITGSGFSGNNTYEGFERMAKLIIVGEFNGDPNNTIAKEVTVLQVKRIVNPTGVWRVEGAENNKDFHVVLKEADNSNGVSDFHDFESEGEWTAFIEGNDGTFGIKESSGTVGYTSANNDTIHGYTGSKIDFTITFNSTQASSEQPRCAIVKVLYNGNNCMHKIFLRKGYNQPIFMGGKYWSSFSLYQASYIGGTDGRSDRYNAVLTKNPLALGSMFRRGKQSAGIFVSNNEKIAPFEAPNGVKFEVGNNSKPNQTWYEIGYRDDVTQSSSTKYNGTAGRKTYNLGTFVVKNDDGTTQNYRVPTFKDFENLTNAADFGFGVVYGTSAVETAEDAYNDDPDSPDAYGLIDPGNKGLFDSKKGMRGVIVYEKSTGNQIFFPIGKFGSGRRQMFNVENSNYYGELRYADVYYLLKDGDGDNKFRPVPYNLKIAPGNIYWIDVYQADVHTTVPADKLAARGCLGWDLNYFNYDFNPYTANNYRDACTIKLILAD